MRRSPPAGFASGPRKLNVVGTPSSRRAPARRSAARVEPLREAEADAGVAQAAGDALRAEVDGDAERFEHVRGAAARRRGPVAVLGDAGAAAGGDEGGDGRDVDGAGPVTAGAARVDERFGAVPRRRGRRARAWRGRVRRARRASRPSRAAPTANAAICASVASPREHRGEGGLRRASAGSSSPPHEAAEDVGHNPAVSVIAVAVGSQGVTG